MLNVEIIETYWNVNIPGVPIPGVPIPEIIETYWNVNIAISNLLAISTNRNNRNILECKFN